MSKSDAERSITFVFLEIFEREGGIQSYVKDIFREYLNVTPVPDADVFLLRDARGCENPFERNGFRFHYFKTASAPLGRIWLTISLLAHLAVKRPQRLYCGHIRLARLAQGCSKLLGIPYTVLTYGKEVWEPLSEGDRQALAEADEIWTISRYTRDRACKSHQIEAAKFKLLPCAVDGDYFTPGPKSQDLIQQYGLEGSKVLMTVARLWSGDIYKGVDVTIRALPEILKTHPEAKYLVIGRGDDKPRLEKLAQDLGVGDQVIFAGFVPTEALRDHYRLADVYVMPSQEGFGIVYLEAMACGIPAISGDADGSADPLQDGKVGWRVPYRDSAAVAQACIEVLNATDQRCDGEWLRQRSLEIFGRPAFAGQLKNLLHRINVN